MDESRLTEIIKSYSGVSLDSRSGDDERLYSLGDNIMAGVSFGKTPVRLTLRCDANLARELKDDYESVVNPTVLSKRNFITILLVGQLSDAELIDLIRHAYEMTTAL